MYDEWLLTGWVEVARFFALLIEPFDEQGLMVVSLAKEAVERASILSASTLKQWGPKRYSDGLRLGGIISPSAIGAWKI